MMSWVVVRRDSRRTLRWALRWWRTDRRGWVCWRRLGCRPNWSRSWANAVSCWAGWGCSVFDGDRKCREVQLLGFGWRRLRRVRCCYRPNLHCRRSGRAVGTMRYWCSCWTMCSMRWTRLANCIRADSGRSCCTSRTTNRRQLDGF